MYHIIVMEIFFLLIKFQNEKYMDNNNNILFYI